MVRGEGVSRVIGDQRNSKGHGEGIIDFGIIRNSERTFVIKEETLNIVLVGRRNVVVLGEIIVALVETLDKEVINQVAIEPVQRKAWDFLERRVLFSGIILGSMRHLIPESLERAIEQVDKQVLSDGIFRRNKCK